MERVFFERHFHDAVYAVGVRRKIVVPGVVGAYWVERDIAVFNAVGVENISQLALLRFFQEVTDRLAKPVLLYEFFKF